MSKRKELQLKNLRRCFQDLRRDHNIHFDTQKSECKFDFNISHLSEIFHLFALRFSDHIDFETTKKIKKN